MDNIQHEHEQEAPQNSNRMNLIEGLVEMKHISHKTPSPSVLYSILI